MYTPELINACTINGDNGIFNESKALYIREAEIHKLIRRIEYIQIISAIHKES